MSVLLIGLAWAQSPEERALDAMRQEVLAPVAGHPLPWASGWSTTRGGLGFGPAYQLDRLRQGAYLLPWLSLWDTPKPDARDEYPSPGDALYYEPGVRYAAEHHLPLCFVTVEWEALMSRVAARYARTTSGEIVPLSPFDSVESWYALGREWAHHGTLRRLQKLYPDPPLVLFVQDSEYPRVSPYDLNARYSAHMDEQTVIRRRAIGDAWIERYRAMLRGFREGLEAPGWRKHALIVGYDQFLDSAVGRWNDWAHDSLYIPGRAAPWPYAWDGASAVYGLRDFFPDTDATVWGPQIEGMNLVSELETVRRTNPAFWFELTVWDGQEPGQPSDKLRFFAARGQPFTPARYSGMVQFGMWLLRPRVVREFRGPDNDRIRFEAYFDAILAAVARVHDDPTLREFWQSGRLLANPSADHPYEENLPAEFAARPRWFLLDSPLNPARPWQLSTELYLFSLAMERGQRPAREWLVYASSPPQEMFAAEVAIPGGPHVRVHATPSGTFTLVTENNDKTQELGQAASRD